MLLEATDEATAERMSDRELRDEVMTPEKVVQESMRLFPSAWCFERLALEDDVIGGYAIPKGTTILIAPYTLHRSPRYWASPEEFDPDRFLPERFDGRTSEAYLPFGDGPRVCIGKNGSNLSGGASSDVHRKCHRLSGMAG